MDKDQILDKYFENYQRSLIKWRQSLPKDTFENRKMTMSSYQEEIKFDIPENFNEEMKEFFSVVKSWNVKWSLNPKLGLDIEGSVNILPVEKVLIGDIDFLPEKYPIMKNFTLLDYFYEEAAVGFYLDKPEKGLFYFEFDSDPKELNLDFKGYLEMLKYTKGVAYWQTSLIKPVINSSSSIIEKMNRLSPEITVEGFYELYNFLKIKS